MILVTIHAGQDNRRFGSDHVLLWPVISPSHCSQMGEGIDHHDVATVRSWSQMMK